MTVYKQYELQEYKNLIDKYKEDEDFKAIFSDIPECKPFFDKKEHKDKESKIEEEEEDIKIYDYNNFKKVKKN